MWSGNRVSSREGRLRPPPGVRKGTGGLLGMDHCWTLWLQSRRNPPRGKMAAPSSPRTLIPDSQPCSAAWRVPGRGHTCHTVPTMPSELPHTPHSRAISRHRCPGP